MKHIMDEIVHGFLHWSQDKKPLGGFVTLLTASRRCFSAFRIPSRGAMSPTDNMINGVVHLVDKSSVTLSFSQIVHQAHHYTSTGKTISMINLGFF